jgi:hypothetical protein
VLARVQSVEAGWWAWLGGAGPPLDRVGIELLEFSEAMLGVGAGSEVFESDLVFRVSSNAGAALEALSTADASHAEFAANDTLALLNCAEDVVGEEELDRLVDAEVRRQGSELHLLKQGFRAELELLLRDTAEQPLFGELRLKGRNG